MGNRKQVWAILVILLAGIVLGGCGTPKAVSPPAVLVTTSKVIKQSEPITIRVVGNLVAANTVTIMPQVTGKLQSIYFSDGQYVEKGQLLATIEPAPFQAAVAQAAANVQMQQSQLVYNHDQYERYKELLSQGAISYQDYESTLTAFNTQSANTANAQAQLDTANINLGYCSITAPISGKIGYIQVYPGNIVTANTSQLAVINQIAPIFADFSVPEQHLAAILAASNQMKINLYDGNDKLLAENGSLEAFNNQITPNAGSLKLRASFSNESRKLYPGQYCIAVLTLGQQNDALIVPAAAIIMNSDSDGTVFVVKEDNTVEARKVTIDRKIDENVIIKSGLTESDTIVTDGLMSLKNGTAIQVSNSAANNGGTK